MTEGIISIGAHCIPVCRLHTVIVGSGAAGLSAADRLHGYGQKDIAIVTEDLFGGTSRNAGSDKQTYYKMTLSGKERDSVYEMAETLFSGQSVDGDIALCEAALSVQCFLNLVEKGVCFPQNRYGEFVGYKTDHDPRRRATSAGPYTSKMMTECLLQSVKQKNIHIFNHMRVIRILKSGDAVIGLLCIRADSQNGGEYAAFCCKNIIYATGGPAGMYAESAYPEGQLGATGTAFEAGITGSNLTEWQYGLASVKPRWNVSGTYMQVLPRFVSTDKNGQDEKEFLLDFFSDKGEMLSKIFYKGYQWPFDVQKLKNGSAIIDILVHFETGKGRRVFLDFRSNTAHRPIDYGILTQEAQDYLKRAGACFGTPIMRLAHMNQPAIDFYRDKGVDLHSEMLEIALCAQHNNGGIAIDNWWQSNLNGFFAIGECAASHGVYRPGGSALNAGQVGGMRAAQYIVRQQNEPAITLDAWIQEASGQIEAALQISRLAIGTSDTLDAAWQRMQRRMSDTGAVMRSFSDLENAIETVKDELDNFRERITIISLKRLTQVWQLRDLLICQYVYLKAMADAVQNGAKSRGSALYTPADKSLAAVLAVELDNGESGKLVQEAALRGNHFSFSWRPVREIPQTDDFFENVWREFRASNAVIKLDQN